jgi:hypothetical protein
MKCSQLNEASGAPAIVMAWLMLGDKICCCCHCFCRDCCWVCCGLQGVLEWGRPAGGDTAVAETLSYFHAPGDPRHRSAVSIVVKRGEGRCVAAGQEAQRPRAHHRASWPDPRLHPRTHTHTCLSRLCGFMPATQECVGPHLAGSIPPPTPVGMSTARAPTPFLPFVCTRNPPSCCTLA